MTSQQNSAIKHCRVLALWAVMLLPFQLSHAGESASAVARIGITKLSVVNLVASESSFVLTRSLDPVAGNQESHVCLSTSDLAPPHTLKVLHNQQNPLSTAQGQTGIPYTASVDGVYQQSRSHERLHSKCRAMESELTVTVTGNDAKRAEPGFYSANLILMVVIE